MNPTVNKDFVLRRIGTKVVRAADKIGRMPALGAQAVLRCAGVTRYEGAKLVVETGQCAIVGSISEKVRVN